MKKILIYLKEKLNDLIYPVKVWLFGDPSIQDEDDDDFIIMCGTIGQCKRKELIAAYKSGKLKKKDEE